MVEYEHDLCIIYSILGSTDEEKMTNAYGMTLAMHLTKQLNSSRKFIDLIKNNESLKNIACLTSIYTHQVQVRS